MLVSSTALPLPYASNQPRLPEDLPGLDIEDVIRAGNSTIVWRELT